MESRVEVEAHASDGIMEGDAAVQGQEEGRAVFRIALGLDLAVCRCVQSAFGRGCIAGRETQMKFGSSVQAQQEVEKTVLVPKGDPEKPLTRADIIDKLRVCAQGQADEDTLMKLVEAIEKIEGTGKFENPIITI